VTAVSGVPRGPIKESKLESTPLTVIICVELASLKISICLSSGEFVFKVAISTDNRNKSE